MVNFTKLWPIARMYRLQTRQLLVSKFDVHFTPQYSIKKHTTIQPASGHRISMKGRIACRAVIEDGIIPFAAYTAAETPSAFRWAGQPTTIAIPVGDLEPSNTWFHIGPSESTLQSASRSFSAGVTNVTNRQTHRQTTLLRLYSNRPHLATDVMRSNNIFMGMADWATALPFVGAPNGRPGITFKGIYICKIWMHRWISD